MKLDTDPVFAMYQLNEKKDMKTIEHMYEKASSGHKHILLICTHLISCLGERMLVLIDEPENHLHPPLLSSFIRALSELLKERNSIALIATHSPIILQEVPKKCVSILEYYENNDFLRVRRPSRETFAENLAKLTYDVFQYEYINSGFYTLLQKMVNEDTSANSEDSFNNIVEKLGGSMSNDGLSILSQMLFEKDQEKSHENN